MIYHLLVSVAEEATLRVDDISELGGREHPVRNHHRVQSGVLCGLSGGERVEVVLDVVVLPVEPDLSRSKVSNALDSASIALNVYLVEEGVVDPEEGVVSRPLGVRGAAHCVGGACIREVTAGDQVHGPARALFSIDVLRHGLVVPVKVTNHALHLGSRESLVGLEVGDGVLAAVEREVRLESEVTADAVVVGVGDVLNIGC